MAGDFEFSIIARFKDAASRGVEELTDRLETLDDYARGRRGGIFGGLFGGFAGRGAVGGPQGGLGGIIAGIGRLTAKAVAMPGKIVGAFASALPKIGGIASGAINSVVNVLQGLVVTAANVAGHIVNALTRALNKVASLASQVFGKVAKWGGVAFAGITAFSVRQAGKVQNAWNKVRTILQLGPKEAREMMMDLRDEAIRTGKSATEVISGYYQVLSAGFQQPRKALKLLRTSLEASVGGWTQLPVVVKLASRTMRAFQKPISEVRSVMDSLMQTVHTGQIEMPELASLFGRLGNSAAQAGFSLEETLAQLGVIARADKPEEVVTQLQAAFLKLVNKTGQARKALEKLRSAGLDISPAAIERIGLEQWIGRLEEARQRFPRLMSNIFPERASKGVNNLIKFQDDIVQGFEDIQESAGTTRDDFSTMMDSINRAASQAWTVVKDLATSFGKPTARWLVNLRDSIQQSGWSIDVFRDKAKAAGETVRDAFKGAWNWISKIAEGRDLDWEGITGGIKEAVTKGANAAWSETQAMWPEVRSTISGWIDEIWAMVGGKIGQLPTLIGDQLTQIAERQMKDIIRQSGEDVPYGEHFLQKATFPFRDAWRGFKEMIGALGPIEGQQFRMWRTVGQLGETLGEAGSAVGQSARNAQRRSRRRGWRQSVGRRGQWIYRTAAQAIAGGDMPRSGVMDMLRSEVRHLVEQRGGTPKQAETAINDLIKLLQQITEDNRTMQREFEKLQKEVRRLATARQ